MSLRFLARNLPQIDPNRIPIFFLNWHTGIHGPKPNLGLGQQSFVNCPPIRNGRFLGPGGSGIPVGTLGKARTPITLREVISESIPAHLGL